MNDYGFKMRTLFGNADALGGSSGIPFAKDVSSISSKCPCGGGESWDTYVKGLDFTVSSLGMVECTGSKCNGAGSNDYYPEIYTPVDGGSRYWKDTDAYDDLLAKAEQKQGSATAATTWIADKCDLTDDDKFGVAFTKNDDWYPK